MMKFYEIIKIYKLTQHPENTFNVIFMSSRQKGRAAGEHDISCPHSDKQPPTFR